MSHESAVDRLIALAGTTQVESYTRRSKTGKTVRVDAHMRSVADMKNNELFSEYKSLAGGKTPQGMTKPQAENRLQQVVNEIRKRQDAGTWGAARKTEATKAQQKAAPDTGSKHTSKEQFSKNRAEPQAKSSDEDYAAHVERVKSILNDPANDQFDTQQMHAIKDPETGKPIPGMYSPERSEQHKAIIQSILEKHKDVPKERKALMSGGLGGAGKGYVLGKHAGVDHSQFLTIDPDEMKQELLKRGMVKEIDGLLPMEHAKYMHEESSDLANLLHQVAMSQGMNVILDTTMASEGSVTKKVKKFTDNGYEVEAVFVDVPVEVSQQSALGRHRGGVDRFRGGVDDGHGEFGGRFVPPEYIEKSRPPAGSPYNSVNREVFEKLKEQGTFTRARVFDNSDRNPGAQPRLVSDSNVKGEAEKQTKAAMDKAKKVALTRSSSAVEKLIRLTSVK